MLFFCGFYDILKRQQKSRTDGVYMSERNEKKIIIDPTRARNGEGAQESGSRPGGGQEHRDRAMEKAMEALRNSAADEKEFVGNRSFSEEDEEEDFRYERIGGERRSRGEYQAEAPVSKGKKGKTIAIIIIACILLAGFIGYSGVALYYQSCFMPGTYINNMDCGGMEVAHVASLISERELGDYTLDIYGKDPSGQVTCIGQITRKDIGMELKDDVIQVQKHFDSQNPFLWIESLGGHEVRHELDTAVVFDEEKVDKLLAALHLEESVEKVVPRDAYLSEYSAETGRYEIIPEVQGNTPDMEKVAEVVKQALYNRESSVNLEEQACYELPEVTAEDRDLVKLQETLNRWLGTSVTYDWNSREVLLDKALLADWISVEDEEAVLDEEAVRAFVADNAGKYDTYGKNRKFVTTLGTELTLPSGAFGWKTDIDKETAALIGLIKDGAVTEREPEYSSKAPWKGVNDIGNTYVEIDLTHQHLYLYQKGQLVLETDFVSGMMTRSDCISPQGVFRVTYKTTNATLRGGDYEQFVYYWMPFHGNFGMHDATWRTEFGGDIYLTDQGSHGCINLPLDKAEQIYHAVYAGHPVICYYY